MATETQMNQYERINHVKRYIREHMDEPLNREELAQLAGFSVTHFHRIFTAHVGENITAYVRRVRMEWAARQLLADGVQNIIAIYPDEPEISKEVRFDAGVIFADGVEPAAVDGLDYQTLPGGRWAIFRHVGPYDTLWQTWQATYRDWLPTSGYELRDAIPFEDYVDDPSKVAPEQLRTDIYVPIK